jgi:hypothetical protein
LLSGIGSTTFIPLIVGRESRSPSRSAKKEVLISSDGYDSRRILSKALTAVRLMFSGGLLFCCTLWFGLICGHASPLPEPHFAGALGRYTVFQLQGDVSLKQRQVAFLNRIRRADPERRTIERAVFNPQNELALILAHGVEMDKIPPLMRSILGQMAREFPGQDLTVFAYAPSNPPLKIGTARFNARTRDMTYTRER